MLAAAQGYDIHFGHADIPEEYVADTVASCQKDYHDNIKQTRERADKAAEIAKKQDTLYRQTLAESGKSFEDNYKEFLTAIDTWEALYNVDAWTGEWGNFNNEFGGVRDFLSEMTDICEAWAQKEETLIKDEINSRINTSIIIFTIIVLIMLVISVIVIKNVRAGLKEMDEVAHRLASGNFSTPIATKSKFTEFVELGNENEIMRSKLRDAVALVIEGADNVGSKAESTKNNIRNSQTVMNDISKAVENLAVGASAMANDVQNTANITIDIGSSIDNVSNSVNETLGKVEQLSERSMKLKEGLDILRKADEETDQRAEQVASSVNETAEVVAKISAAADKIINIASQTNLLALNASIEAARAGDAGRGFSVVAENIKGLATESDRLASEITAMLKEINNYSERNKGFTASIKESIANENESLTQMIQHFNDMLSVLDQAKGENEDAAKQTSDISNKKEGILSSVESLSSISEENAASTEETSASLDQLNENMESVVAESEKLHSIAEELKRNVAFFKI
jgi:methyl-accepting chemotaxis protein